MNWMEMSLSDFERELASKNATPGGGTAAAVALGQAAALAEMVCELTVGSEKWKDGWEGALDAKETTTKVRTRAGQLAVEDSESFNQVMAAFRLPKTNEKEVEVRRSAIRLATLHAAEVPLETAKLGMELLAKLESLALNGNANAASDVGVASLLASAAVKGALFNVEINVASLPEAMATSVVEQSAGMRGACSEVSKLVMHAVHNRIQ